MWNSVPDIGMNSLNIFGILIFFIQVLDVVFPLEISDAEHILCWWVVDSGL